jgi:hypothetical protein
VNEDNLCNVRREASRHFRKKKREYLKDKITEIELNSMNKNIRDLYRDITEFKNAAFDVIGQRLIRFSISFRYWRKSGSIMAQYISYL